MRPLIRADRGSDRSVRQRYTPEDPGPAQDAGTFESQPTKTRKPSSGAAAKGKKAHEVWHVL